jgi:hypothetical protein
VGIAETAYQFLKAFSGNKAAVEYIVNDQLFTYPRKTKSLVLNGIAIVKKSEYTGMGHDGGTCFGDPDVLDWLFSQSLANR